MGQELRPLQVPILPVAQEVPVADDCLSLYLHPICLLRFLSLSELGEPVVLQYRLLVLQVTMVGMEETLPLEIIQPKAGFSGMAALRRILPDREGVVVQRSKVSLILFIMVHLEGQATVLRESMAEAQVVALTPVCEATVEGIVSTECRVGEQVVFAFQLTLLAPPERVVVQVAILAVLVLLLELQIRQLLLRGPMVLQPKEEVVVVRL